MKARIHDAISEFEKVFEEWSVEGGKLEKWAPLAYSWTPDSRAKSNRTKSIDLTLQAITHGNEWGGIDAILTFAKLLKAGVLRPDISMGFVLANHAAAVENRRFLERDLNRAFGRNDPVDLEGKRAKELEPILEQSAFFLDFHQTIEPTLKPFFIFPYTPACYNFAISLQQEIPIVTHWGNPFSRDGMCTDEYVNFKGGVGITIELGQKGFDVYHAGVGLQAALGALKYVSGCMGITALDAPKVNSELYTWRSVIPFASGLVLREGLVNFQSLHAGENIGQQGAAAIEVPHDGLLLFPKYQRDPKAAPPKELYRILKKIEPHVLGKEGVIGT